MVRRLSGRLILIPVQRFKYRNVAFVIGVKRWRRLFISALLQSQRDAAPATAAGSLGRNSRIDRQQEEEKVLKKRTCYAFPGSEFWVRLAAILPVNGCCEPARENYPIAARLSCFTGGLPPEKRNFRSGMRKMNFIQN